MRRRHESPLITLISRLLAIIGMVAYRIYKIFLTFVIYGYNPTRRTLNVAVRDKASPVMHLVRLAYT
jgi:hypothetical protein